MTLLLAAGTAIDTDAADDLRRRDRDPRRRPRRVELMAGRIDDMVTVSEAELHDAQTS